MGVAESVRVRCPECLREQSYAVPVFPCACGTPVVPPVIPGATGEPITHRNWTDEWVTVRCVACGREDEWPHPELGCACGTVLRVPVLPPGTGGGAAGTAPEGGEWRDGAPSVPGEGDRRPAPAPAPYGGPRTGGPEGARTGTRAGSWDGVASPWGGADAWGQGDAQDSAEDGGRGLRGGEPRAGGAGDLTWPEHRDDAGAWTEGVARTGDRDHGAGRPDGGRGEPESGRPDGGRGGPESGRPDGGRGGPESGRPDGAHGGPESGRPDGAHGGPESDGWGDAALLDGTAQPGLPAAEAGGQPGAGATGLMETPDGAGRGRGAIRPHGDPDRPSVPAGAAPRAAYRPVVIRTARDAVAASAGYLRWLGFRDVVQPEERSTSGVDLRAPGLVAQVDPSTRPSTLRAVECLWLNGLSSSAAGVFFSLAGYTPDARSRADDLGIPLFVLDLTGTPQPVNSHAEKLISAPSG
ncbi:hypothetical protein [Streptomyces sp. NPDC093600]|uniref:hypothetical protein n=1 Tax=Streptomyces sp. NPDC093600 TaxID=3366047 RepID=UPI00381C3392